MTLPTEKADALFTPEPVTGTGPSAIAAWASRQLDRLATYLRTPEVARMRFAPMAALPEPGERPIDGMVVYGLAGVYGATEGLYLYTGGAWKKFTVV